MIRILQTPLVEIMSSATTTGWSAWKAVVLSCWVTEATTRPAINEVHVSLKRIFDEQSAVLPPMREIGALVIAGGGAI